MCGQEYLSQPKIDMDYRLKWKKSLFFFLYFTCKLDIQQGQPTVSCVLVYIKSVYVIFRLDYTVYSFERVQESSGEFEWGLA